MAIAMPIFCTPLNTKNVFTVLHHSPTSKIYSTTTLHGIYYESQEAPLRVLQFFDANGSQKLLTMPGRVPKNIVFFLQTL
jgi:Ni/Fe-hydrogenase subunit HybB-like protein